MSYIILIFVIIISIVNNKFITSENSDYKRFINLTLLVVSIWAVQNIIEPETCDCKSDSLLIASLIALALMMFLHFINKFLYKNSN